MIDLDLIDELTESSSNEVDQILRKNRLWYARGQSWDFCASCAMIYVLLATNGHEANKSNNKRTPCVIGRQKVQMA